MRRKARWRDRREYIGFLQRSVKIPVVFLDFYYKDIAEDAVVMEGFYGMYLMTEYLFERGFTRMAYVGSIHAASSIMDRFCGFRRALLEHGIPFRQEWLLEDRDEAGKRKYAGYPGENMKFCRKKAESYCIFS